MSHKDFPNRVKQWLPLIGVASLGLGGCTSSDRLAEPTRPHFLDAATDVQVDAPVVVMTPEAAPHQVDAAREAAAITREAGPTCKRGSDAGANVTATGTFVVNHVSLGDQRLDGTPDTTAWETMGKNLDGIVSRYVSPGDHCDPYVGAEGGADLAGVYQDGRAGIDNSFGKNVMPAIARLIIPLLTGVVNTNIQNGGATFLLDTNLETLPPDSQHAAVQMNIYNTAAVKPALLLHDGTDDFPVDSTQTPSSASATLDCDTIDAGPFDTITFTSSYATTRFDIPFHHAFFHLELNHSHSLVVRGWAAGVLRVSELVLPIDHVIKTLVANKCGALPAFEEAVRSAQDILADGTNRAGVPCDGVSAGIAFTAEAATTSTTGTLTSAPGVCP